MTTPERITRKEIEEFYESKKKIKELKKILEKEKNNPQ